MFNWTIGVLCGMIFCVGAAFVVAAYCNDASDDKEWKNLGHEMYVKSILFNGHSYVVLKHYDSISIVHDENCNCNTTFAEK